MTARHNAILVTLDKEVREDDLQDLLKAIRRFDGVLTAVAVPRDVTAEVAEHFRVRQLVATKLTNLAIEIQLT